MSAAAGTAVRTLLRLVYVSRPAATLQPGDVRRLLWAAQIRNRRRDVTGMLLYTGQHFAQVIEGRSDCVLPLLATIAADQRHSGLRVVQQAPIQARQWSGWSMAYVDSMEVNREVEQLQGGPCALDAQAHELMHRIWLRHRDTADVVSGH